MYKTKGTLMSHIKSKDLTLQTKAVKALEKECEGIFQKYPKLKSTSNQRLKLVCPILQAHYRVNILVHQVIKVLRSRAQKIFYLFFNTSLQTKPKDVIRARFPEHYDHSLPRIDIHQHMFDDDSGHIGVISHFRTKYEKDYGWTCVICSKAAKDFSSHHKCTARTNCRSCHRFRKPGAMVYSTTKKMYCKVGSGPENPVPCPLCNMDVSSAQCMEGHTSFVCKRKYKCPLCSR